MKGARSSSSFDVIDQGGEHAPERGRIAAIGAFAALTLLGSGARAQEKKLTLLTWNLPIYEEKFRGWIADFKELHPDFEVEWLDKKGTEWATFYQTQLVAGTAPDIIDVQGMLWAEYAANDGLVDLTPYLAKEPEVKERFNQDGHDALAVRRQAVHAALLLLQDAHGLQQAAVRGGRACPGRPRISTQIVDDAKKIAATGEGRSGFITLNFDWLYWALFAMNGVELLNEDMTEAAFNTPEMLDALTRLAEATTVGRDQQHLLDRALGRAQQRLRDRRHRHVPGPRRGPVLDRRQGRLGQSRHARRGRVAGRLGRAQRARLRHLELDQVSRPRPSTSSRSPPATSGRR